MIVHFYWQALSAAAWINMDYIAQLEKKIEKLIGRKISFYLASKFISDQEHIILFNSKENDFNR